MSTPNYPPSATPASSWPCVAGEELLIDYGCDEKGMYRFARTYGFIDRSRLSVGDSAAVDTLRIATVAASAAGDTPSLRRRQDTTAPANTLEPGVKVESTLRDHVNERPGLQTMTDGIPTLAAAGPSRGECMGSTVGHLYLTVDLAALGSILARGRLEDITLRRQLNESGEHSADLQTALERRLRCYRTTLEEDLDMLRRLSSRKVDVAGASGGEVGGEGVDLVQYDVAEKAMAEWERACLMVRAAEKIALCSAIGKIRS